MLHFVWMGAKVWEPKILEKVFYLGLDERGGSPLQAWSRIEGKVQSVSRLVSPQRELRPPLRECPLTLVIWSRVELVCPAEEREKEEEERETHIQVSRTAYCRLNPKT